MRSLRLCALLAVFAADMKETETQPEKQPVAEKTGTPTATPSATTVPPTTAPSSTASASTQDKQVTVVGVQNLFEPFYLAHEVVKDSLPIDQLSLEPIKEIFRLGSEAGSQAYEQVAATYDTHGPTVRQVLFDSVASCEVVVAEGKKFGQSIYKENLGAHLDPHVTVVQDLYENNVRGHVDTAYQAYSDIHPVLRKLAFDTYDVTHSSLGTAYSELHDQVFLNVLPATQIGAERTVADIKDKASILFEPIEIAIRGKTLLFPYGVFDVAFASVHWLLLLSVGLYTALGFSRFLARFSSRFVRKLLRCVFAVIKSIFSLAYLLIVKISLGLLFLVLRIVTLNYLCKCCGICAKRKKVRAKVPLKQAESKQKAAAESKSATKKTEPPPPPPSSLPTMQSKSKKKH